MNDEEILLIEQAKGGSQKAFVKLYDTYKQSIISIIRGYTQDISTIQELSAIVLSKIYYKLDSFIAYDSFKSWAKTIAINTCIDYQRKNKRVGFNIKSVDDENVKIQLEEVLSVEEEILNAEKRKTLYDAIKKLPLRQRKAIQLYYFEGYLYKDIAKKLAVPEGTIKSDLNRAKSKLKQLLTTV